MKKFMVVGRNTSNNQLSLWWPDDDELAPALVLSLHLAP